MYSIYDISHRTVFVLDCIFPRELHVHQGLFEIKDLNTGKALIRIPFQKLLAIFAIGHASITTPLIDKCRRYNVALIVLKPNLRPVFFWSYGVEGNFLLHQKQYAHQKSDLHIAKQIVANKLSNQLLMLERTRRKDSLTQGAVDLISHCLSQLEDTSDYNALMGLEGRAAKHYFGCYFMDYDWSRRRPRLKNDYINTLLDIGYTLLFNLIECYARIFGFDPYIGVYHCMWYQRKSFICDIMEPFRSVIEHTIRCGLGRKQFHPKHFENKKGEYRLKHDHAMDYYKVFFSALIVYKQDIFVYMYNYYRAFMKDDGNGVYPEFTPFK